MDGPGTALGPTLDFIVTLSPVECLTLTIIGIFVVGFSQELMADGGDDRNAIRSRRCALFGQRTSPPVIVRLVVLAEIVGMLSFEFP